MAKKELQSWAWRWGTADWPVVDTISHSREASKAKIIGHCICDHDKTMARCWKRIQQSGRLVKINFKFS
jgi:hypothetical protein